MWSGTAISLCFVGVRLLSRVRSFRKLFVDDFLVIFSWTLLLVSAILWQTQQTAMYNQFKLAAGTLIPTLDVLKGEETFLKSSVALIIFYFTSLWLIKLSFLIFFRRLSSNIYRWHQIWWWCVLGFTVASYATVIGTMGFGCLLAPLTFIMSTPGLHLIMALLLLISCSGMHHKIGPGLPMANSCLRLCH